MIGKKNRLFGAVLLVSGTTIGAGMLALPVTTGLAGFFPSLIIMSFIWLFMMLTAFYFLEVNLRIKEESNMISMIHKTLGRPGEIIAWIVYLFLLYALTASYLVGCSQILSQFYQTLFSTHLPQWFWPLLSFLIFGIFVYFGTEVVDFLNRALMVGLVLAYVSLIGFGCCNVQASMLSYIDWKYLLPSISVVFTTFGYHIIIPTLTTYLEHDSRLLKRAIFIGSLLPFIIYILWQLLVMSVVPVHGEISLSEAARKGLQVTFYLNLLLHSRWVSLAVTLFAFFAIMTSLLGVSLSLTDFLADGLKIKKTRAGRFYLILLTFSPPLLFALFYPQGFILALNYAGICVAILLALLPALMAYFERYRPRSDSAFIQPEFQVPGGKVMVIATILVSLVLLGFEVLS